LHRCCYYCSFGCICFVVASAAAAIAFDSAESALYSRRSLHFSCVCLVVASAAAAMQTVSAASALLLHPLLLLQV
jgi:hypothetical protein